MKKLLNWLSNLFQEPAADAYKEFFNQLKKEKKREQDYYWSHYLKTDPVYKKENQ